MKIWNCIFNTAFFKINTQTWDTLQNTIAAAAWLFFLEFLSFFLSFSRFSPLFHDFLIVFLSFFQQEHVRNDEQFSFFSNCVYHCFQVVCFNILGRGSRMYVCRHAPIHNFPKQYQLKAGFVLASLFCRLVLFFRQGLVLGVFNGFLFRKAI